MVGRIVELTAVVLIAAYVARHGSDFSAVINAIGSAYSGAINAFLSKA
jgi:hypothetical protein